jgi:capsular polysaccharide transport system permease protein
VKRLLRTLSARNLRLGLLAVPLVVAALYLSVFAADRYVAESIVTVRQNSEASPAAEGLTSLIAGNVASSREDLLLLRSHILSLDMLLQVDKSFGLRQAWSAPKADLFFRLAENASQEEFLRYYRDRVEAVFDEGSGLLTIRTQAFTPALAQSLNRELMRLAERFINETSHRLAREQMAFAEEELVKARAGVGQARNDVRTFQNKHGVLDPVAQAQATTGLTVELQAALARQTAELRGMLGYLNEDSFQVQALRNQIAATRAQLQAEAKRGIAGKGGAELNTLAGEYQDLLAELQFAQDKYKLSLAALEAARIESTRKLKSLVVVESPAEPQSADYPRRAYVLIALLFGLSLVYGIARLVVATIEDHQE